MHHHLCSHESFIVRGFEKLCELVHIFLYSLATQPPDNKKPEFWRFGFLKADSGMGQEGEGKCRVTMTYLTAVLLVNFVDFLTILITAGAKKEITWRFFSMSVVSCQCAVVRVQQSAKDRAGMGFY
jgi:hypothetical protein